MRIETTVHLSEEELQTPVGEYMSPPAMTFLHETTVQEALLLLQQRSEAVPFNYFYIIDHSGVLQGVIAADDLLYNSPETLLADIMESNVVKVEVKEPLAKALYLMNYHKILILPVINNTNCLLGVLQVTHKEAVQSMRLFDKKRKEDLFQFIGFTIEQGKLASSTHAFRTRMPWLAFNLLGGIACAFISYFFMHALVSYVFIAFFIPLVLTLSESVAIQAMTLSLRFLHFRKIIFLQIWRRLLSEWKASMLLSIACAIVVALFYFVWGEGELRPLISISSSLFIAMVTSASLGALFPIFLHLAKLDPKVASGPLILMFTDVVTMLIYLGVATLLLL